MPWVEVKPEDVAPQGAGQEVKPEPPEFPIYGRPGMGLIWGAGDILGTPINLANLFATINPIDVGRRAGRWALGMAPTEPPPDTMPPLPGGSEDINRFLTGLVPGYQPPQTLAERLLEYGPEQALSFAAPGAFLRKLGLLGEAPSLISAGRTLADVVPGLGAGAGQAAAESLYPESETAKTVGAVGGAMTIPALRGLFGQILHALGGGGPLSVAQEAIRETAAKEGMPYLPSDITGGAATSKIEQAPIYSLTGVQPVQKYAIESVKGQEKSIERALAPIPPPGETMTEWGQTIGEDISKGVEQRGAQAIAAQEQQIAQARTQAAQAVKDLRDTVGPTLQKLEVADLYKKDFAGQFATFQKTKRQLFDATETITENEPVISLSSFGDALDPMMAEAAQTGQAIPRGAGAMSRLVHPEEAAQEAIKMGRGRISAEELSAMFTPQYMRDLSPERKLEIQKLSASLAVGEVPARIPFWLARRLESSLGEMGYRGGQPLGTLSEGRARVLHYGIRQDINQFLKSTEAGQKIAPELKLAKEYYIKGDELFNESVVNLLFKKNPAAQEQFVNRVFVKGNLADAQFVKESASPETWKATQALYLTNLYQDAMIPTAAGQVFSPRRFAGQAQSYIRSGKLDIFLEPSSAERAAFDQQVQEFSQIKEKLPLPPAAKPTRVERQLLSPEAEKRVGWAFEPGMLSRTQKYEATVGPARFEESVRVWVAQLSRDIQVPSRAMDTGAYASAKEFVARVKPLSDSGQLDLMLKAYPGVADHIKEILPTMERMALGSAEKSTLGTSGPFSGFFMTGQLVAALGSVASLLHGVLVGDSRFISGGISTLALFDAVPYLIAKFPRSEMGHRLLIDGLAPRYNPAAIGFAARILGQSTGGTREETEPAPAQEQFPTIPTPTREAQALPAPTPPLNYPPTPQRPTGSPQSPDEAVDMLLGR